MSSEQLAISLRGVGKSYTIRHQQSDHVTLAEVALERIKHPLRRSEREEFWALRDLDLDVRTGEVLGLIGRNGAGKSTLLKVLSRITAPSTGEISLWGRVGSLLEVGTGFHPELTGRENVYLNGSVLGMSRREIDNQFDAIVEFAGVERFLDTPVKRYSSGMYVRLAFAVAAHLETEILLIDEVLAVGDADFQKRCLGKIHEVAHDGRTVLYVSHQLSSIASLCDRAVVLKGGRLEFVGEPAEAISRYTGDQVAADGHGSNADDRPGTGEIRVVRAQSTSAVFECTDEKRLRFDLERRTSTLDRCYVSLILRNDDGLALAHCDSSFVGCWYELGATGTASGEFRLGHPWLQPGRYTVDLYVCNAGIIDCFEGACSFSVADSFPYPAPEDHLSRRDPVVCDYSYRAIEGGPAVAPTQLSPASRGVR